MTDHKTVREALEYLRNWQSKDGAGVVVETATEALAALDRIEALTTPPAPTVMGDDVRESINDISSVVNVIKAVGLKRAGFNEDNLVRHLETLIRAATQPPQHPDDAAVDAFAATMKEKLAKKRAEGRGGWDDKTQCSAEFLSQLLREHVQKGDPVDVANLAMMLGMRGEGIAQPPQATDVSYLIRDLDIIRVILQSSKDAVSADFQRIERLQEFIRKAALQSPAVPREVVERLEQIRKEQVKKMQEVDTISGRLKYDGRVWGLSKSLALLGGKEG